MAHTSTNAQHSTGNAATDRAPAWPRWLAPLRERPLAACATAFILGIACAPRLQLSFQALLAATGLLICTCAALVTVRRSVGAVLLLLSLVAGVAWRSANSIVPPDDVSRLPLPTRAELRGTVISTPVVRGRCSFVLRVAGVKRRGTWEPASGKVRVSCTAEPEGIEHGSKVEMVGALRQIGGATNPGEFSYARYLARQGIRTQALVGPQGVRRWERPRRRTLASIVMQMRDTARLALHRTMPGTNKSLYASLVASMVYGVTAAPLPREIVERFRQSGTIHVLVVSGAQISLLAISLLCLLRARRGALHWWHAVLVLPVLALFALMVGYGPSVRRAVAMCMLLLFAGASRRDYDAYTGLAVAGLIIMLLDPEAAADVGAQLSFAAAFGVIHFAPRRRQALDAATGGLLRAEPWWLHYGRYVMYGSFGAWAMVVPILAHHFRSFPTLSAVSNIVVVPLSGVLVVTGFITTGAALVLPPIAVAMNWMNRHLIDAVLGVVKVGAALPFGYETATYMPLLVVILWYAVLLLVVAIARSEWRERVTWPNVLLVVLVVAAVLLAYYAATLPGPRLSVALLDVGDGDCIVIRSPSGKAMLVDAGERLGYGRDSDVAKRVVLPYLLMQGISRLDYVVATHPHDDHISGLPSVLREMRVGRVLECGLPGDSAVYERYVAAARAARVQRRAVRRGERIDLGSGAVAAVLAPARPLLRGTDDDLNNNSVVIKLVYGEVSFLLTGDLQAEGEARLLRGGSNLRATVLKVPHHGAATSCTPEFLRAVSPRWALISTGGSAHLGHPSEEVIERLEAVGAQVLRTDIDGAITVETDGRKVRVHAFAAAHGP